MDKLHEYLGSVGAFSGAALVARDGEILLREASGFADRDKGIRNGPDTVFGVGSITKSVTALCIMKLVEDGLIRTTDRLDGIFPGMYPDSGITIHHLLNHTSGLGNHIYLRELQTGAAFTPRQILDAMARRPLKSKPGRKWSYTNTGYLILAEIIATVSGKPYHEFVRDTVLRPLGMDHTGFDGEGTPGMARHGRSVFDCHPSLLYGAGDMVSNVDDLLAYDQALYGTDILKPETIARMQEASHKSMIVNYGYGWFVRDIFRRRCVSHAGFHPIGYTSSLDRFPQDRVTVIVLSNVLDRYSPLGIGYFNSIDAGRELGARVFGAKARPWQKLT